MTRIVIDIAMASLLPFFREVRMGMLRRAAAALAALLPCLAYAANAQDAPLTVIRGFTETLRHQVYEVRVGLATGADCERITHSFIRGEDADGTVHITVRCVDSGDWIILEPVRGESAVVSCERSKAIMRDLGVGPVSCWLPIGNPPP